jgi:Double zinc ribbon/Phospholipase_D-nuclease N-terminal
METVSCRNQFWNQWIQEVAMPVKNETSTRFADEMRIISPWASVFAALGFAAVVMGMVLIAVFDKSAKPAPPLPVLLIFGILAGTLLACYILLIGYINQDAGRRGMSRLLWTLIAIFVPNALGIVLYFVLRKPRTAHCPQCASAVEPSFGFCPRCRHRLNPVCPHCQRGVNGGDKFCPYCGGDLGTGAIAASTPVPNQG